MDHSDKNLISAQAEQLLNRDIMKQQMENKKINLISQSSPNNANNIDTNSAGSTHAISMNIETSFQSQLSHTNGSNKNKITMIW